ncbi:pyridoxamine 5'-phosphate oxidase family protein [Salipiger abyssi]|uniref:pyridoxamine 5'-phosphate oxidase family protein n=1 Tax=Salipiger abyssi TaxID=1250539 RepID=UPI004057CE04
MAKQFDALSEDHIAFIEAQHMFFVGSAAPTGRVNVSPKGMDTLRVLGPNRIAFLNLTGSGNETAGHLLQDPRITLMWCGFEKRPLILRAYGTARMIQHSDPGWGEMLDLFPDLPGARQICEIAVELVQNSCGYAVPYMEFAGERDTLRRWAETKGYDGLRAYWAEKNAATLDGAPTGIEADAT